MWTQTGSTAIIVGLGVTSEHDPASWWDATYRYAVAYQDQQILRNRRGGEGTVPCRHGVAFQL
jgi:hypothetical protein